MVFTQQTGGFQMPNNDGILRFCAEHWQCKDCPLLTQEINFGEEVKIICNTGRAKGGKENE